MSEAIKTYEQVQNYYGEVLKASSDLKTDACCPSGALPDYQKAIVSEIHPEILDRFYGCGSPIPLALEGKVVLDLGCGTGRDAYLLSKLVGENGKVIGVDMTESQLEVAQRHQQYHAEKFGFEKSNVHFHLGRIEDLAALGIDDASVDVVVSNCVINLSPEKERLFVEIFRVLKPGGELYFADIFSDRRIPGHLASDPVLRGECLGGAMYMEDFRRMLGRVGCADFRVVSSGPLTLNDPEVISKVGPIKFDSVALRAFKLPLEDLPEDYGQTATYLGTLPHASCSFTLDQDHEFKTGKTYPVSGNTADILGQTRFADHFRVEGDKSEHRGRFRIQPEAAPETKTKSSCC